MAIELHLPDLTEGSIELGAPARGLPPRPPLPWHQRLRELVVTYLPLLLMLLLALGTWWLVKNTPAADEPRAAAAPSQEPDYTMDDFVVERFDKDGRLKVRLQGEQMRHYADRDLIEVDRARLRAVSAEGRVLVAHAQREVQLIGDAHVDSTGPRGEPVAFRGEFLHVFVNTERVRSHLPVTVHRDGSEFRAAGMDYDHLSGLLQLQGKMRAQLLPNAARSPVPPGTGAEGGAPKDSR